MTPHIFAPRYSMANSGSIWMSNRFTRISMVEYEHEEAMRISLQQYEDKLAPKVMEYAEDIRITVTGPTSALWYITYPDEESSLVALELRKEFTKEQTLARLVKDVIYFDGYLEFSASRTYYSKIKR